MADVLTLIKSNKAFVNPLQSFTSGMLAMQTATNSQLDAMSTALDGFILSTLPVPPGVQFTILGVPVTIPEGIQITTNPVNEIKEIINGFIQNVVQLNQFAQKVINGGDESVPGITNILSINNAKG